MSLPIPSPDYASNVAALKAFLQAKPEYVDVNFDGSMMRLITDVLAYNTTINAFYLNQVGNEAFLQTAIQTDSVVANAQDYGYSVKTATSASATIYLTLTGSVATFGNSIALPINTIFSASIGTKTFTFRTLAGYNLIGDGTGKYSGTIVVYEGKALTHKFTIDSTNQLNGVVLPNKNVDASKLIVSVSPIENPSLTIGYTKTETIISGVSSTSQIYFTSLDRGQLVRVKFGDGVFGKKLNIGDVVSVQYLISSTELANGVSAFTLVSGISGTTSSVVVVSGASGGASMETNESIKFNAPKYFESQGRAVTENDYKVLVTKLYPNAESVLVWGGEKNVPPKYGKVIISIKPYSGYHLTSSEKANLVNLLSGYNVTTVVPEIIDPEYLYIVANATVSYDTAITNKSSAELGALVSSVISNYNKTTLGKFSVPLQYGSLSIAIGQADPSIISNKVLFTLEKRSNPALNSVTDIIGSFGTAIKIDSIDSSTFTFNNITGCKFIESSDRGYIDLVTFSSGSKSILKSHAGTINHVTGDYAIGSTYLNSLDTSNVDPSTGLVYFKLTGVADSLDVDNAARNILEIYASNVVMVAV
ncbi:MAG: hypothetical protein KGI54_14405 [Pseudomonadota bacterium]|nr:hypothetical protein [Pseudomonadota bacterium]